MTTDPAETRSPSILLAECAAMLDEFERVERASDVCPTRLGKDLDNPFGGVTTILAGTIYSSTKEPIAQVFGIVEHATLDQAKTARDTRGLANAAALVLSRNALPWWLAYARKRLKVIGLAWIRHLEHPQAETPRILFDCAHEDELSDIHATLAKIKESSNG